MASVTLATLVARVRERADQVGSSFVADTATGLYAWINEAHQKLHGMIVDAMGEEYVSSSYTFNTVADQSDYALPTDFYKLYALDITSNGYVYSLSPYNRSERDRYRNARQNYYRRPFLGVVPRYLITGSNLRLLPVPREAMPGTVYYAPEATTLATGTDAVNYPNGWERFIVLDAAIQTLAKEESDTRTLATERDAVVQEINATKEARDLANPHKVVDVNMQDLENWW